ncbi:MAG: enoyl-CoA hydratase/isomerase family protein [Betaproteobacteria bacterium]
MRDGTQSRVKVTIDDRVAVLRLSDPDRRNAMSLTMREQCIAVLRRLEEANEADAIIITGEGDKAFSAGADLDELAQRTTESELSTRAQLRRDLPRLVESLRLPTLAAISGYCLGAGLELALACTLRIAADGARLGLPEINLGVIPGSGGTQRLARLVGLGRAMELVTLGDPIDAAEAWRIGLVNRVVAAGELMNHAMDICRRWQAKGPVSLMLARDAVLRSAELDLASGIDYENKLFALALASGERDEGVKAFRARRKPRFRGGT